MPYDVKRFIFSVSLCAMLAVNPVLATAPTNDEDLDTTHEVYTELSESANGIAGVSYVNRMVNAAGNAAELAEGHAAAAGAHALSAAQSADEAHKVLADKVNIDQGADNKNKVMVTDYKGTVYPGYITNDMIQEGTIGADRLDISGIMSGKGALLYAMPDQQVDGSGNLNQGTGTVLKYMPLNTNGIVAAGASGLEIVSSEGKSVLIVDGSGNAVLMPAVENAVLYSDQTYFSWARASGGGQFMQSVQDSSGNLSFTFGGVPLKSIETPLDMTGVGLLMLNNGVISVDEYDPQYDASDTVLTRMSDGTIGWQKVEAQNTDGVVGMVPVGGEGATT